MEKSLEECYFEIYTRILQGLYANYKIQLTFEEPDFLHNEFVGIQLKEVEITEIARNQASKAFEDLFGKSPNACDFKTIKL